MRSSLLRFVLSAACLFACGKGERGPAVGGETHWLELCDTDDDCGRYSCECGVCTVACAGDDACGGGRASQCYAMGPLTDTRRCGGRNAMNPTAVCLPTCVSNDDCQNPTTCVLGACLPPADTSVDNALIDALNDAGAQEVVVDWSQPVTFPEVPVGIEGADGSLDGVWIEKDCVPDPNSSLGPNTCMTLELRTNGAHAMGTVTFDSSFNNLGPFAPVSDPSVGYPTELPAASYRDIELNEPGRVPMRVLDGRQEGGRLTFSFTPFDVWSEWCALQRSYRWDVAGQTHHFCIPQDEQLWSGIDEGKIVLCNSVDHGAWCEENGTPTPCACAGPLPLPRCRVNACSCDAERCGARLSFAQRLVALQLQGTELVGSWHFAGERAVVLTRSSR